MSHTPTPAWSDPATPTLSHQLGRTLRPLLLALLSAVIAAPADTLGSTFHFLPAPMSRTADDGYEAVVPAGGYRLRLTNADRAASPRRWDSALEILDRTGRTLCKTRELLVSQVYADADRGWIAVVHESGSNTYVSFVSMGCTVHYRVGKYSDARVEVAGDQIVVTAGRDQTRRTTYAIQPGMTLSPTR